MQVLQLIIFAALAAVVLYQLYAVLGRRVGRQPEDNAEKAPRPVERTTGAPVLDPAAEAAPLTGLALLRARDPSFDPAGFAAGARSAYEMIVQSFAEGDRQTLRNLLAPQVYESFDQALSAREAEGRSETVEFLHPPRADIEDAEVEGGLAKVRVRFLAELRARSRGPEGEAVDDRRTAEIWTFERRIGSADPNWLLVRVDPADA